MLHSTPSQPLILLVEDNPDDVLLVQRAFYRAGLNHPFQVAGTGGEAVAYLNGGEPYNDRIKYPFPALVLLDINLPVVNGLAVLKWIRGRAQFSSLCVVMLTSSDEMKDVKSAGQQGANAFLVKPLDFWNAAELSRSLGQLLAKSKMN